MNVSGFSTGNFAIVKSDPSRLMVRHSRLRGILGATFLLGFVGVWYWFALDKPPSVTRALQSARETLQGGLGSWILLAFPLLMVGWALGHLVRVLALAHRIELNARSRTIRIGSTRVPFDHVQHVQLRRLFGGDGGPEEFLVSVVLNDKSKLRLLSHWDRDRVLAAADDIADFLGTQIHKVGD